MEAVLLKGNSISDIELIMDLAKKLGLGSKRLTEEEIEDMEDVFDDYILGKIISNSENEDEISLEESKILIDMN